MVCFINPATLEMEDVPRSILEERFFTEEDEEDNEFDLQHKNWDKCINVEPPESRESFEIMENFIDEVDDKNLQRKLLNALERRHPFANFKNTIENSDYRKAWFAFKQSKLEEYVWRDIEFELNPRNINTQQRMQRYIEQLIEDLDRVAENPPDPQYIEVPPHLDDNPEIAELALVPFKPISEWTGIGSEVFPNLVDLSGDEWEKVNEAIFRVFESLHIDLVDAPEDLPPEMLYEVLTTNWDYPVQYLPLSGMDLELCTGDPMTCPYGEYCDCDEEPDFSADEPPANIDPDEDIELPF
jgi:hypothetical protein